jgi:transcriptional regulator with GAF, ATPase, and Fis domain
MNKFQPVFEISLTPTEPALAAQGEPQLGVRTDFQLHLQTIGELVHALLTQLDLLQYESDYGEDEPNLSLRDEVRRFEINLIRRALTRTHGSQVEAARVLGLKATTLNAKMKRYRLHRPYLAHFAPRPNTGSCDAC